MVRSNFITSQGIVGKKYKRERNEQIEKDVLSAIRSILLWNERPRPFWVMKVMSSADFRHEKYLSGF